MMAAQPGAEVVGQPEDVLDLARGESVGRIPGTTKQTVSVTGQGSDPGGIRIIVHNGPGIGHFSVTQIPTTRTDRDHPGRESLETQEAASSLLLRPDATLMHLSPRSCIWQVEPRPEPSRTVLDEPLPFLRKLRAILAQGGVLARP